MTISIWSSVVIGELEKIHRAKNSCIFTIEHGIDSLEDIKIKTKNKKATLQGKSVEVKVEIDILCLIEDSKGKLTLLTQEQILRDKLFLDEFNSERFLNKDFNFQVDIKNITYEGDIKDGQIEIIYFVDYWVIAVTDQIINLGFDEQGKKETRGLHEAVQALEEEVVHLREKNEILRRKLYVYEKNISSLKKGIHKAEKRNTDLNKDLKRYETIIEELRLNILNKDPRFIEQNTSVEPYEQNQDDNESTNLGAKIKRLFMNSG
ncbi:hypothetical protein SYNTR_1975 [Candidatus Syntrophocurvum alkaliphilum]|uniref:Uncharacterized protein n=1 Tax=Candidatus Syntrophocurvum alkaliphilum TaxID=2293317 RepID=A0A6I6DIR6_9FIRM|nr:hypothetical protein [Candidatus Syntrophocurvum alkaliphilum]QGU00569.1 hypothetical protein SYNTR_1975 [Candidatus Syntrophocurvum alkaliphilum]